MYSMRLEFRGHGEYSSATAQLNLSRACTCHPSQLNSCHMSLLHTGNIVGLTLMSHFEDVCGRNASVPQAMNAEEAVMLNSQVWDVGGLGFNALLQKIWQNHSINVSIVPVVSHSIAIKKIQMPKTLTGHLLLPTRMFFGHSNMNF